MTGTIGIACGELARFTAFTVSLACTSQPPNTQLSVVTSASVVENLNVIVRAMRPDDEWLWIVGDDHCWAQDTLEQLLAVMDDSGADIVCPLVCRRNPPWDLVTYREEVHHDGSPYPHWTPYGWGDLPDEGWFEVAAAGTAGMLIHRRVLDQLGDPCFQASDGTVLNEDVLFCQRARAEGFRVVASADIVLGHIGIYKVWPARKDGRWGSLTDFSVTSESSHQSLFLPGGPRANATEELPVA